MGIENQTLTESRIQTENQTLTETQTNRDRGTNRFLAINQTKTVVAGKIEIREETLRQSMIK